MIKESDRYLKRFKVSRSDFPMEIENFLSPEECKRLIKYFKRGPKRIAKNKFWDERVVPCKNLTSKEVRRIVEMLHYKIIGVTCGYYNENYLYPDFSNIVYWGSDMVLHPHCDNMHIYDSKLEHNTPQRDYSAVWCLNEEYEGGHTIFPEHGKEYPGKTGRLIVFPSGRSHPHGVTEVTSGSRYTFSMWMTKDVNHLFYSNNINRLTNGVKTVMINMKQLWKRWQ